MAGNGTQRSFPNEILIRDGDYVRLTDIDTAGYLFAKGLNVEYAHKATRYKFEISLYDPEHKAEAWAIEFVNSCCAKTCSGIRRLKSVVHKFHGSPDRKNGQAPGTMRDSNR